MSAENIPNPGLPEPSHAKRRASSHIGKAGAQPATLSAMPTATSLLLALQRRWFMALSLGLLLAAAVGAAAYMWLPPTRATARTLMRIHGGSWFGKQDAAINANDPRTHLALIKSRLVLTSALKQEKVAALGTIRSKAEPVEWLEKEIQADFSLAPEVLRISLSGDPPEDMIVLVNAVRDAYKNEVLDKERTLAQKQLGWLAQQREFYESQLRQHRELQRSLEEKAGGSVTDRGMTQAFKQLQLNYFERDLLNSLAELRRAKAELSVQQSLEKEPSKSPVSPVLIEELLERDPDYQRAQAAIKSAKKIADDFKTKAVRGEKDPGYAPLAAKIKTAETALSDLRGQLIPIYDEAVKKRQGYDTAMNAASLVARIEVLQEDVKSLQEQIEKTRTEIKENSATVVKIDEIKEDLSAKEKLAKHLADQEESLAMALRQPERVTVVEDGIATRGAESKRLLLAFGIGSGGSLVLVCFATALWEFRARRVNNVDDVVQGLGMNLVGMIPDVAQRYPRRKRDEPSAAESALSESVDATRTMLLRAARDESLQVVMVTSAQSGEGKTLLSTHLAASMAQIGRKVLLIDGDMRNPIAHQVFGLPLAPGLCELLRGEVSLDEAIQSTPVDQLSMITAGQWDSWATRALAQDATANLLQQLRERFDFVLIDSSPTLPVVDPLLIGQHVDGTILAVLRDVSRMSRVYAAHQRLAQAGIRVLGAVVNGVRSEVYGGKYAYPYASSAKSRS